MWNIASNLYLHPLPASPDPQQSNLGSSGQRGEEPRCRPQRLRIQRTEVSLCMEVPQLSTHEILQTGLKSASGKRLVLAFQPLGSGTAPMNTPSANRVKLS